VLRAIHGCYCNNLQPGQLGGRWYTPTYTGRWPTLPRLRETRAPASHHHGTPREPTAPAVSSHAGRQKNHTHGPDGSPRIQIHSTASFIQPIITRQQGGAGPSCRSHQCIFIRPSTRHCGMQDASKSLDGGGSVSMESRWDGMTESFCREAPESGAFSCARRPTGGPLPAGGPRPGKSFGGRHTLWARQACSRANGGAGNGVTRRLFRCGPASLGGGESRADGRGRPDRSNPG
jgi:hypothetical protein